MPALEMPFEDFQGMINGIVRYITQDAITQVPPDTVRTWHSDPERIDETRLVQQWLASTQTGNPPTV